MVKRFVAELPRKQILRAGSELSPRVLRKVFSPTLFPINVAVASFMQPRADERRVRARQCLASSELIGSATSNNGAFFRLRLTPVGGRPGHLKRAGPTFGYRRPGLRVGEGGWALPSSCPLTYATAGAIALQILSCFAQSCAIRLLKPQHLTDDDNTPLSAFN
jgi:hypothetical protein